MMEEYKIKTKLIKEYENFDLLAVYKIIKVKENGIDQEKEIFLYNTCENKPTRG